ncbi:MAG: helix-turn-helix transcriptional regulator [Rhizobiaceae bacterium]|nr:helix-turn-helix transcriptional regulator [Rhizobiaceae bacterium]
MSDAKLEKFGKFIERYRCQARMAQGQLGKLLDVRSSYITSLENGEIWPEDHIVDQLALVFGIPHEYLNAMLGQRPAPDGPRPNLI